MEKGNGWEIEHCSTARKKDMYIFHGSEQREGAMNM